MTNPQRTKNGDVKASFLFPFPVLSDSGGIQTHNLLIRSQMLYSVELRNLRSFIAGAKVRTFSETTKYFADYFVDICVFSLLDIIFIDFVYDEEVL